MQLWVKILKPRSLFSLSMVFAVIITLNCVAFNTLQGSFTTINWALGGGTDGPTLSTSSSRTVYTSSAPTSLIKSLNMIEGVTAKGYTLAPTVIQDSTIIFRGVENITEYSSKIIIGSIPEVEGPWLLLGERAYKKLGFELGELIPVTTPFNQDTLFFELVAVYQTGTLNDWEAVVPLMLGSQISNRPGDRVNFIKVENLDEKKLQSLTSTIYNLTLIHGMDQGTIHLLDSLGTPVKTHILNEEQAHFTLPFGYYQIIYVNGLQSANLSELLLNQDMTINLDHHDQEEYNLVVNIEKDQSATIQLENGSIVQGEWRDSQVLFKIPPGEYVLHLNNGNYSINVFQDMIFNPQQEQINLDQVKIKVYSQEGAPIKQYTVIAYRDGEAYTSRYSPSEELDILLPEGEWELEIYKPPYSSRTTLSLPTEIVEVRLPTLLKPSRIPLNMYKDLGVYNMIERSDATLSLLLGLSIAVILASSLTLFSLSMLAALSVQRGIYISASENLNVLKQLGAGWREKLRILGLPLLFLSLAIALLSGYTSILLSPYIPEKLTLLGYGLQIEPLYTQIYSAALGLASWLVSFTRLIK